MVYALIGKIGVVKDMEKLSDKKIGDKVKVIYLTATDFLKERMLALGFTEGAVIEVIRKAPSGDPTLYYIRETMIALRKEEADKILVMGIKNN
ncbi:FeoA family protein [Clostridium sp. DL1XJH146]